MNFDDELLAKANASGTWADFSDDDVISKSAERMNMMKAGGKKDLSKLVPVQKQITRNGKQITQTVWVKPGSDEEKEAKQPNNDGDKKESSGEKGGRKLVPAETKMLDASKELLNNKNFKDSTIRGALEEIVTVVGKVSSGEANSYEEAWDSLSSSSKADVSAFSLDGDEFYFDPEFLVEEIQDGIDYGDIEVDDDDYELKTALQKVVSTARNFDDIGKNKNVKLTQ